MELVGQGLGLEWPAEDCLPNRKWTRGTLVVGRAVWRPA